MITIVRYKNGTLYNKADQEFTTLEAIRRMQPGTFIVISSSRKRDITAEVRFLAEVDEVRRKKLWDRAHIIIK